MTGNLICHWVTRVRKLAAGCKRYAIVCCIRFPQFARGFFLPAILAFTTATAGAQNSGSQKPPVRLSAYQYFVQVGAFTTANAASALVEELQKKNISKIIIEEARDPGDTMARVLVGPFDTNQDALVVSQQLIDMNYQPILIGRPLHTVPAAGAVAQAPANQPAKATAPVAAVVPVPAAPGATNAQGAATGPAATPPAQVAQAPQRVGKSPAFEVKGRPEVQAIPEIGGVLTPKDTLAIEPSVEYANSQVNRFTFQGIEIISAILLGIFDVEDVDRDVITSSVTGRWGFTNRLEGELKLSYVDRSDDYTITIPQAQSGGEPATTHNSLKGNGMGDVEIAAHYQFNQGLDGWPFFVGNLRYKFDNGKGPFDVDRDSAGVETQLATGTGFTALEPSLTALYPSDPAMLFGNIGYLIAFDENVNKTYGDQKIEKFMPGNALRFNVGMAYAVNPRTSFTLGYKQDFVDRSSVDINNINLDTSSLVVGSLFLSYGLRTSPTSYFNFTIEAGMTADAPDMRVSVSVPLQWAF
jgi:hypothetical protein